MGEGTKNTINFNGNLLEYFFKESYSLSMLVTKIAKLPPKTPLTPLKMCKHAHTHTQYVSILSMGRMGIKTRFYLREINIGSSETKHYSPPLFTEI